MELQEKIDACQTKIAEDETMHNEEKEKLQMQITQLEAEKEQKDISIRRLEIICKSKDKDIPLEYIEALEMIMKLKSKEQASYNPAVDREKLHIWLDLVYDDFAGRLLEKYQLTGRERDVCYLKALDFSDDEISELLKIQLSFHPAMQRSTRTSPTRERRSPFSRISTSSVLLSAIPPPLPPSV